MGIIVWIIFGALVGWIASIAMHDRGGWMWNIAIGVVGALIGGFIMSLLGKSGVSGFNLYSFLVALLGACLLIGLVKVIKR